jgi:hypothetical protein
MGTRWREDRAEADPVFLASGATQAALTQAVADLNAALAAKQASATAATDAELQAAVSALETLIDDLPTEVEVEVDIAAAVAAHAAGDATDAELSAAVASLTASIATKQDASTAATDTELADAAADLEALLAAHEAGDATDAELTAASAALTTLIGTKQDAATAATDAELAAHAAATEGVHGIADTAALVTDDDARLTDARAPTAHDHDERYYTEAESDVALAAIAAASVVLAPANSQRNVIQPTAAEQTPLTLKGHAAQGTTPLFDLQTSAGASLFQALYDGTKPQLRLPASAAAVTAGRGPSVVAYQEGTFESTLDPTGCMGYNQTADGQRVRTNEHGLSWFWEGYYMESGVPKAEAYVQYIDAADTVQHRPFFTQLNLNTDKIEYSWVRGDYVDIGDSDNQSLVRIERNVGGGVSTMTFQPITGLDSRINVKAPTGKGGELWLGGNGTEAALTIKPLSSSDGATYNAQWISRGRTVFQTYANPMGANGAAFCVGGDDNSGVGVFITKSTASNATKGLVARAKSGQTGNQLEVQDSSSNPLSGFTENGYFFTRKTSAVADAELAAGEMALWFDPTNGAAKLMVKAKQADGTVRTGSLALA